MAEMRIDIYTQEHGSEVWDRLKGKAQEIAGSLTSQLGSAFNTVRTNFLAFSVAGYGAMELLGKSFRAIEDFAAFDEMRGSLQRLSAQWGTTADDIVSRIKDVAGGLVSMKDATEIAGSALKNNLSPDQIYNMARATRVLSDITGDDVPASFRAMTEAVALGRERALETSLGIIDLNSRFGDQVTKMTDVEKAAGRYQIVMERVAEIEAQLGETTETLDDKIAKMKVSLEDVRVAAGEYLARAFLLVTASVQSVVGAFYGLKAAMADALAMSLDAVPLMGAVADRFRAVARDAVKDWGEWAARSKNFFDLAIDGFGKYAEAAKRAKAKSDGLRVAEDVRQAQIKESATQIKGVLAEWEKYYSGLKSLHDQALSAMEAKQKEYDDLVKASRAQQAEYDDLVLGLKQTLMTADEKYFSTQMSLQQKFDAAMVLSGQAKIDALAEWQRKRASFIQSYDDGYGTVITTEQATLNAIEAVGRAQAEITSETEKLKMQRQDELLWTQEYAAQTKIAMDTARSAVQEYKDEIEKLDHALKSGMVVQLDTSEAIAQAKTLDAQLEALTTAKTLKLDPHPATVAVTTVKTAIDSLGDKTITIETHDTPALDGVNRVRAAIDLIPNITYKDVVIRYRTEGSPSGASPSAPSSYDPRTVEKDLADRIRTGRSPLPDALRAY